MAFNEELARQEALRFCSHYSPRTLASIGARLKRAVPGFYPKTDASKLGKQLRRLLAPLVASNLLLVYKPENKVWARAREMATKAAKARGESPPRNVRELYQTNFLYLTPDPSLPVLSLPKPKQEMNFELCALMHRFRKPKKYTWEMLNLLMCASDKRKKDDLRIHLYMLPFDYNEIELLESVLDFGVEFASLSFPFRPDINEAKGFLGGLAVGK